MTQWTSSGSNRCPVCGELYFVRKDLYYKNGKAYTRLLTTCECS